MRDDMMGCCCLPLLNAAAALPALAAAVGTLLMTLVDAIWRLRAACCWCDATDIICGAPSLGGVVSFMSMACRSISMLCCWGCCCAACPVSGIIPEASITMKLSVSPVPTPIVLPSLLFNILDGNLNKVEPLPPGMSINITDLDASLELIEGILDATEEEEPEDIPADWKAKVADMVDSSGSHRAVILLEILGGLTSLVDESGVDITLGRAAELTDPIAAEDEEANISPAFLAMPLLVIR